MDASRIAATIDHSIPTRKNRFEIYDDSARIQVETLQKIWAEQGIKLFDFDSGHQGIVHVIGPELGFTQPGMTIVCGDSHTSTHGAFGALAFGIGTSEVGHVLATGAILQRKPKTMRVEFSGSLKPGVFSKDIVLKLIAEIGISGANGHIVEFCGDVIRGMSMEQRMTVCNMSIECGARAGLISPDDTTLSYLQGRRYAPKDDDWERAAELWRGFATDEGATYDRDVIIDVSSLTPMVTWGTNPEQAIGINEGIPTKHELPLTHQKVAEQALRYMGLPEGQPIQGTRVDWAFIGSCTNRRPPSYASA